MDQEQNDKDWQRLLDQTADPEEREFYANLHQVVPDVTLEFRDDGKVIMHGIGLKDG